MTKSLKGKYNLLSIDIRPITILIERLTKIEKLDRRERNRDGIKNVINKDVLLVVAWQM